jgi:hypothetical protein
VGFLSEGGGHVLLLLQECSGGKDPSASGIVHLLCVGGGGDHGIEFLPKLGSLGSLSGVIGGHRRWCHGAYGGGAGHQRCSGRREGGRP